MSQALPDYDPAGDPAKGAGNVGASGAALAETEATRLRCELRVLRNCLPELEETAESVGQLWQASFAQQEKLVRGRMEQDRFVETLQSSVAQLQSEKAARVSRNEAQARELEALRRTIETMGAGGRVEPPRTPLGRSSAAGEAPPFSPLSPLLAVLDETSHPSRGKAYWRRANMYMKVASIADYWQAASHDRRHVGTPQVGGHLANASLASAVAEKQGEGAVEVELAMAPHLRSLKSRLEDAARGKVVSEVLRLRLDGSFDASDDQLPAALSAAAAPAVRAVEVTPL